jgi:hypothetical protein
VGCEWTEASREHEQLEGKRLRTFRAAVLCALLAWPAAAVAFSPPPPPFYSAPLFIPHPSFAPARPGLDCCRCRWVPGAFLSAKAETGKSTGPVKRRAEVKKKRVASCGLCPLEG